jgi:hypothetical protein
MKFSHFLKIGSLALGRPCKFVLIVGQSVGLLTSICAETQIRIEPLSEDSLELNWTFPPLQSELETSTTLAPDSWTTISGEVAFVENRYRMAVEVEGTARFYRLRQLIPPSSTIAASSPSTGAEGVAVSRETVISFTTPLAESTTLDNETVYAEFAGQKLASVLLLSSDRKSISLFYNGYLPGGSVIRVMVNGDKLTDIAGRKVDADGNGSPGGIGTVEFTTLAIGTIPNTAVVGHVYAAEKALVNGVPTDVPLQGVTVFLDGKENTVFTTTDANGYFKLMPVPAGEFFVHIVGISAEGSNYPNGDYYPIVGKAWNSIPGKEDTLAGGTGVVYLPFIKAGTLQPVSNTQDTVVTFPDSVLASNPELEGVFITVPANSLFSWGGVRGGMVGMAPVPPDRLPSPLPEGLNVPLVITIQSDPPGNFDIPAPVCFPNLPDPVTGILLPPGAKTALWSFNHDSGQWEIQGSMTISADGKFAVSDPGVGIKAPGWHFPVSGSGGGGPGDNGPPPPDGPKRPDEEDCEMTIICTTKPEGHNIAHCLLKCLGNVLDRLFGDEDQTERSPLELGFCLGNVTNCNFQDKTMSQLLEDDKYDKSLSSNQKECMDECLIPGSKQFPMVVPCTGYTDPCPPSTSFSPGDYQFLLQADPEFVIPRDWLAEQIELWKAQAHFFSLVVGTPKIAETDPQELGILRAFLNAFREAVADGSPSAKLLSPEERTALLALPKPSQFDNAEWMALMNRMELMMSNALPAEQYDSAGIQAAAQTVLDVTQILIERGWERHEDGLIYGLEKIGRTIAPVVGSEEFPKRAHYYLLHNFNSGFDVRERLTSSGKFQNLILTPNQYFSISYVDPVTLNVGAATFFSAAPGIVTQIPTALMEPDTEADSDNDGLSDTAEGIIGTSINDPDSDNDGISDSAEVINGTNPLFAIPASAGIVATVETQGLTADIAMQDNLVALAKGADGVALVDVSNPYSPIILSEL